MNTTCAATVVSSKKDEKKMQEYYSVIKGEDMKEEMGGVIHTIDSIVVLANRVWMRKRAAKIMTNLPHLIFPGTRAVSLVPPPKTPELHLSLVYDIIRGNIAGSANSHMDVALEISHDYPASGVYLDAIETLVPQHAVIQRIADKKRKAVPISRGVCKLSGCTVNVHPRFWRQKLCYRHGGQQEKLCKKCFIRCGKGGGGLCSPCHDLSKDEFCRLCLVRRRTKPGGICDICTVGPNRSRKKKQWVHPKSV